MGSFPNLVGVILLTIGVLASPLEVQATSCDDAGEPVILRHPWRWRVLYSLGLYRPTSPLVEDSESIDSHIALAQQLYQNGTSARDFRDQFSYSRDSLGRRSGEFGAALHAALRERTGKVRREGPISEAEFKRIYFDTLARVYLGEDSPYGLRRISAFLSESNVSDDYRRYLAQRIEAPYLSVLKKMTDVDIDFLKRRGGKFNPNDVRGNEQNQVAGRLVEIIERELPGAPELENMEDFSGLTELRVYLGQILSWVPDLSMSISGENLRKRALDAVAEALSNTPLIRKLNLQLRQDVLFALLQNSAETLRTYLKHEQEIGGNIISLQSWLFYRMTGLYLAGSLPVEEYIVLLRQLRIEDLLASDMWKQYYFESDADVQRKLDLVSNAAEEYQIKVENSGDEKYEERLDIVRDILSQLIFVGG